MDYSILRQFGRAPFVSAIVEAFAFHFGDIQKSSLQLSQFFQLGEFSIRRILIQRRSSRGPSTVSETRSLFQKSRDVYRNERRFVEKWI